MKRAPVLFSNRISKKYIGKYIAVADGKIIAVGKDSLHAFEQLKWLFPDKKEGIGIYYIPNRKELVTCL